MPWCADSECIRKEGWSDRVQLNRVADHFIFTVESSGCIAPEVIVREASLQLFGLILGLPPSSNIQYIITIISVLPYSYLPTYLLSVCLSSYSTSTGIRRLERKGRYIPRMGRRFSARRGRALAHLFSSLLRALLMLWKCHDSLTHPLQYLFHFLVCFPLMVLTFGWNPILSYPTLPLTTTFLEFRVKITVYVSSLWSLWLDNDWDERLIEQPTISLCLIDEYSAKLLSM